MFRFPRQKAVFFFSVPHFDKRNIVITTSFTKFKSGFPRSSYPCDRRKATDNIITLHNNHNHNNHNNNNNDNNNNNNGEDND